MRRRRSWHTSFRQLALRSNAVCQADDIGALAQERTSALLPPSQTHTSLSHTPSFPHIHTYMIFLRHTPSFTYHFITRTTVLTFRSFSTSFVFPSFPVPATTFGAHYWKKLTCGVIRSLNCFLLRITGCTYLYPYLRVRGSRNKCLTMCTLWAVLPVACKTGYQP